MAERPNPDRLLAKYDCANPHVGQLTIFLGAAAGVGKTYAMLKLLPQLRADGVDVVIGYVEAHQRPETLALLPQDIETIPQQLIYHKGHALYEVDVDAILARKPQVVLIDELAHSNVPGSRNLKRYQDVLELLAAGINVYSALNIQHVESLNDIVEQITGVVVTETVPDSVLENASQIKLIDVTPDELIERLKDGKIYAPERAAKALENFFRKGNLTALREMALLKTAQKVEQQVQEYRSDQAIGQIWASHEKLLVVIEPGYSGEKTLRSAKAMFDKGFSEWYVVYIDNDNFANLPLRDRERLIELLEFAKQLGAETAQLSGHNQSEVIVDYAREKNINTVVLSQYRLNLYYRLFGTSLVAKLGELAPELNLHLIRDEIMREKNNLRAAILAPQRGFNYAKLTQKLVFNLAIFTVLGLLLLPLSNILANENILMLYLLAIIIVNYGRGKLSALLGALVATVSFDFFFIPPRFSFAIADVQYVITFLVMAAVGIAFSIVNGNLRYQVSALRKAQRQSRLLYDYSRRLAEAMIEQQVIEITQEYIAQLFKVKFALLIPHLDETLTVNYSQLGEELDLTIASWVFDRGQNAGLNTNTFAGSKIYYLPINSQIRVRGVLAVLPLNDTEFFLLAEQELLASLVGNLATTLERIHFTQIAIKTEVLLAQKN